MESFKGWKFQFSHFRNSHLQNLDFHENKNSIDPFMPYQTQGAPIGAHGSFTVDVDAPPTVPLLLLVEASPVQSSQYVLPLFRFRSSVIDLCTSWGKPAGMG